MILIFGLGSDDIELSFPAVIGMQDTEKNIEGQYSYSKINQSCSIRNRLDTDMDDESNIESSMCPNNDIDMTTDHNLQGA